MDALAASLEQSPELFPHDLDLRSDSVSLLRLSETDYARASFLDARILGRQTIRRIVPYQQLRGAVSRAGLVEHCDFIFHIGHVGSTLLSRLLGADSRVFALREPAILRTFAQVQAAPVSPYAWSTDEFDERLSVFLKLWSRTFRAGQRACVKATSFVSELASRILARPAGARAILMFVPAETYLATILGGPNSRQESKMLASSRLARLQDRIGNKEWTLASLSEGEVIAMSWACEMTALAAAAETAPEHVLWLNFDSFLGEPAAMLRSALQRLGIDPDNSSLQRLLSGPEMRRYSKAPEHAYDAHLRRAILAEARREQPMEMRRGLAWLDSAAGRFPAIKRAMDVA